MQQLHTDADSAGVTSICKAQDARYDTKVCKRSHFYRAKSAFLRRGNVSELLDFRTPQKRLSLGSRNSLRCRSTRKASMQVAVGADFLASYEAEDDENARLSPLIHTEEFLARKQQQNHPNLLANLQECRRRLRENSCRTRVCRHAWHGDAFAGADLRARLRRVQRRPQPHAAQSDYIDDLFHMSRRCRHAHTIG